MEEGLRTAAVAVLPSSHAWDRVPGQVVTPGMRERRGLAIGVWMQPSSIPKDAAPFSFMRSLNLTSSLLYHVKHHMLAAS